MLFLGDTRAQRVIGFLVLLADWAVFVGYTYELYSMYGMETVFEILGLR